MSAPRFSAALAVVILAGLIPSAVLGGSDQTRVVVRTSAELSVALANANPGTTIALAAGVYEGGLFIHDVSGSAGAPIVIDAADPDHLPIIRGGDNGIQFSDVSYVTMRRLVFENQRQNGINIDDGDTFQTPSHHITLSYVTIRNVLGEGAAAAVKLAGVQDFVVEDSTIAQWGGGSAITMVGCRRGVVRGNTFSHRDDAGSTGVQMKGGSTGIMVRENRFEHAGLRAVQVGGSTGDQLAKDCIVERNVIIGSEAAVAFVNMDGSIVRENTIYRPGKWILRILQESVESGFVSSRRGVVTGNLIVYAGDGNSMEAVNVGARTDASSFRFERNWWYRADRPSASRPQLPSKEIGGVYGRDPGFVNATQGDFHLVAGSAASAYGAYASPPR